MSKYMLCEIREIFLLVSIVAFLSFLSLGVAVAAEIIGENAMLRIVDGFSDSVS